MDDHLFDVIESPRHSWDSTQAAGSHWHVTLPVYTPSGVHRCRAGYVAIHSRASTLDYSCHRHPAFRILKAISHFSLLLRQVAAAN